MQILNIQVSQYRPLEPLLFQSKGHTLHSLPYLFTLFKSGTFPPPFFVFLELDILKTGYFVECTRGL